MKINELRDGMRRIEVEAKVIQKSETREVRSRYTNETYRVADATIEDETGTITLTLWNEQIDQVKAGMKVHIENGWVGEFQGEPQLTTGKFGKLEVVGEGEAPQPAETPAEEPKEEPKEQPAEELSEEPVTDEEEIK